MNSAMPIEIGSAISSASAAAQMVPKSSGPTYAQKLESRIEASSFVATSAGRLCTMRKIATAARVTRIIDPAKTAEPEKTRSPGRCFAVIVVVAVVICRNPRVLGWWILETRPCPTPASAEASGSGTNLLLDRVDRSRDLLAERVRDGGGARVLGRHVLALGARDVRQVRLHELEVGRVLVLAAGDQVADEHDRVDAGLFRGAVDLDREVAVCTALGERRVVGDRSRGLGRVRDELVADLDRDGAEVAGAGGVGVADGARAVRHGVDDARGALGRLATLERPHAVGLVRPHVGSGRSEVVGEVLGRAGVIR